MAADLVLIAHPEAAERARLVAVARRAGFEAIEASDGETAARDGAKAIVALVSPLLSRMDGLEVCNALRSGGRGSGPAVVLLNDVYPVAQPKEQFLRDFGLSEVLAAPASAKAVTDLLERARKLPKRSAREQAKSTRLNETPLMVLLGRARARRETGLLLARRDGHALFIVLVKGEVAQVRSNLLAQGSDEDLLTEALEWTSGEGLLVPDPAIEETSTGRLDLGPLLERASFPATSELIEIMRGAISRSGRVILELGDAEGEHRKALGLTLFEAQLLELADGARSLARLSGLAEVGSLPLPRLLLRLEATGLLRRRRPGASRQADGAASSASPALLDRREVRVEATGLLAPGDLARLLVRLERRRDNGVLAVRRDGQTIEIALNGGRVIGASTWGDGRSAVDPVHQLAATHELRPEDVPVLRQLHAQRLVIEALRADHGEWSLRTAEAGRKNATLDLNPASLIMELLRDDGLRLAEEGRLLPDEVASAAAALQLTNREANELADATHRGRLPPTPWLRRLGYLLDPTTRIGRSLADRHHALAGDTAPRSRDADDDLDELFDRAENEGLEHGARAGAPRARPSPEAEDFTTFGVELSRDGRAPTSFSLEQTAGGVVIQVGDRHYAIDALIQEVDDLRREKVRLRTQLGEQFKRLASSAGEATSARRSVDELDAFIAEMRNALETREREATQLLASNSRFEIKVAQQGSLLNETTRRLQAETRAAEDLRSKLETVQTQGATAEARINELVNRHKRELADLNQGRERGVEDLRRERDGFRDRATRLEAELSQAVVEVRRAEDKLGSAALRVERAEKDLTVARSERDDLAAQVTSSKLDDGRRGGFFRELRSTRAVAVKQDESDKLSEERRTALEQLRRESTERAHRVIEAEGQVARRQAEVARFRREVERLEEKLTAAQAEAKARAESEGAHQSRWEKAERLLAERTTSLQVRDQELEVARGRVRELVSELERMNEERVKREAMIAVLEEERSGARERLHILEAELGTLRTTAEGLAEERSRLQHAVDEAHQAATRATAALEASRTAREEQGARLAEATARRAALAEEREKLVAESARYEADLRRERDERGDERARLEGRLEARGEELESQRFTLEETQRQLGQLRDLLPALTAERDTLREASVALEARVEESRTVTVRAERVLAENRAAIDLERKHMQVASARAQELTEALASRDAHLASMRSELDQAAAERQAIRSELEHRLADHEHALDKLGTEYDQAKQESQSEISTWKARSQRFEERFERQTEELDRLRAETQTQLPELERLRGQMSNARKRVHADGERIAQLIGVGQELKTRAEEGEKRARELELLATNAGGKLGSATVDLASRTAENQQLRAAISVRDAALAEARERLLGNARRQQELTRQVKENDERVQDLQIRLRRSIGESKQERAQLQDDLVRARREAHEHRGVATEARTELAKARDAARDAQLREREARAIGAQLEAQMAKTLEGKVADVAAGAMLKRARALQGRIAELEREVASHISREETLKRDLERLEDRAKRAVKVAHEAQRTLDSGSQEADVHRRAADESAKRIQQLERLLSELETSLEMRDLVIAERDSVVDERDEALAARGVKERELNARIEALLRSAEAANQRIQHLERDHQTAVAALAARQQQAEVLERDLAVGRVREARRNTPPSGTPAPPPPAAGEGRPEADPTLPHASPSGTAPPRRPTSDQPGVSAAESAPPAHDPLVAALLAKVEAMLAEPTTATPERRAGAARHLDRATLRLREELLTRQSELGRIAEALAASDTPPGARANLKMTRLHLENQIHARNADLGLLSKHRSEVAP